MDKFRIIGVTGPTGAGKSALAEVFEQYGCRCVDCDVLSRQAVEPGMPALDRLAQEFGEDVIREDGSLDRALLAQRAFPTPEGREQLNGIVHPAVIALLECAIERYRAEGAAGVAVDAPLLFEAGLEQRCDAVIAVVAPDQCRLERIMARDGLSEDAARLRMSAQKPCEYYSERADYTIVNDSTGRRLHEQTQRVLEAIFKGEDL